MISRFQWAPNNQPDKKFLRLPTVNSARKTFEFPEKRVLATVVGPDSSLVPLPPESNSRSRVSTQRRKQPFPHGAVPRAKRTRDDASRLQPLDEEPVFLGAASGLVRVVLQGETTTTSAGPGGPHAGLLLLLTTWPNSIGCFDRGPTGFESGASLSISNKLCDPVRTREVGTDRTMDVMRYIVIAVHRSGKDIWTANLYRPGTDLRARGLCGKASNSSRRPPAKGTAVPHPPTVVGGYGQ
ncbi:hypothetical protein GW17_00030888 [Ensete ventricosum]|nr:hypothetical protein GW17_00030888 [Ensete ventricosum]